MIKGLTSTRGVHPRTYNWDHLTSKNKNILNRNNNTKWTWIYNNNSSNHKSRTLQILSKGMVVLKIITWLESLKVNHQKMQINRVLLLKITFLWMYNKLLTMVRTKVPNDKKIWAEVQVKMYRIEIWAQVKREMLGIQ